MSPSAASGCFTGDEWVVSGRRVSPPPSPPPCRPPVCKFTECLEACRVCPLHPKRRLPEIATIFSNAAYSASRCAEGIWRPLTWFRGQAALVGVSQEGKKWMPGRRESYFLCLVFWRLAVILSCSGWNLSNASIFHINHFHRPRRRSVGF